MADEGVESGQETQESPTISEASAAPTSSPVDVDQIAERVAKFLEPRLQTIERASQSLKDKRLARLETSVEEIAARFKIPPEELAAFDRERKIDRILEREEAPQGKSWADEWQEESEEILVSAVENFGVKIERGDPDFQAIVRGSFPSKGKALAAVNKLVAQRSKQGSVAASAVAGEGTGRSHESSDLDGLRKSVEEARKKGLPIAELRKRSDALKEAMRAS